MEGLGSGMDLVGDRENRKGKEKEYHCVVQTFLTKIMRYGK